ncbi:hypothetical protein ACS0TY_000281 [Phlomoides rotata]
MVKVAELTGHMTRVLNMAQALPQFPLPTLDVLRTLKGGHASQVGAMESSQWLHTLEDHTSAVKGLSWCPFQGSPVYTLLWNRNERELLSSQNQLLRLWKYSSPVKDGSDGCTVASVVGDETLKFWNVFGMLQSLSLSHRQLQSRSLTLVKLNNSLTYVGT